MELLAHKACKCSNSQTGTKSFPNMVVSSFISTRSVYVFPRVHILTTSGYYSPIIFTNLVSMLFYWSFKHYFLNHKRFLFFSFICNLYPIFYKISISSYSPCFISFYFLKKSIGRHFMCILDTRSLLIICVAVLPKALYLNSTTKKKKKKRLGFRLYKILHYFVS